MYVILSDNKNETVCDHCVSDHYKDVSGSKMSKRVEMKILRHFSIISYLERLYMSAHTSEQITWHKNTEVEEKWRKDNLFSPKKINVTNR